MDYELEVAQDAALASPEASLVQEGNDITKNILQENDPAKLEDLTNLFNGDLASNLHLTNVNFLTGYLVLLIWSLILIYGFKYLGERKG